MTTPPPPVHHEKALFAQLGFSTELSGTQAMRPVTRYSWPWLVFTAVLALVGIWVSPFLPYWGSIVLGFVVAVATFVTGAQAAVKVLREIQKKLG
jgi:predicted cobalt transporter CbtA